MEGTLEGQPSRPHIPLPSSNGPRPHKCEVCQRSFREIATLRKHEQLHRADRPYICQTCGKSFLWSSNLKVHERVHTGERPYKCKICHRCFTQSNDLRRHERNVHMRGKYGYRNASKQGSQVNLAAYQAFALQQRALLQQAFTYESLVQTAAASQARSGQPTTADREDGFEDSAPSQYTRESIKLEQVTPPSTPAEYGKRQDNRGYMCSPTQSGEYAPLPSSSVIQNAGLAPQSTHQLASSPHYVSLRHADSAPMVDDRRASTSSSVSYSPERPTVTTLPHIHTLTRPLTTSDTVIDLSINKPSTPIGYRETRPSYSDSESCEEKRDVTTTSVTPTGEVHHCHHCDIMFHDYTMYHLHRSLHSPSEDDPFLCPSCNKRCQDRLEFTFHLVWHVKYPHTIPNYQPFKEGYPT